MCLLRYSLERCSAIAQEDGETEEQSDGMLLFDGPAFAGGLLIGLAALMMMAGLGRIAGISGLVVRVIQGPGKTWALAFMAGLVLAAPLWILAGNRMPALSQDMPLVLLGIAGFLVGLGTRIGSGCTSGHGVCGLSRLSMRSLAAVVIFMATAAVTLTIARHIAGVA